MGEDEKGKIVKEHADINIDIALDDILTQPCQEENNCNHQGRRTLSTCVCVYLVDNWENFWETPEGCDMGFWNLSEEEWRRKNPQKIKPEKMKQLRQEQWRTKYSKEELENENRI